MNKSHVLILLHEIKAASAHHHFVLALIFRMLNPALKLSLSTSLKFRMVVLFADISFPKRAERIV
jgi:hypothetical protein